MANHFKPTPLHLLYPDKDALRALNQQLPGAPIPEGPLAVMYLAAATVLPQYTDGPLGLARIKRAAYMVQRRLHPEWARFYEAINVQRFLHRTLDEAAAECGGYPQVPELLVHRHKRVELQQQAQSRAEGLDAVYSVDDPLSGWFPRETLAQRRERQADPAAVINPASYRPYDRSPSANWVRQMLRADRAEAKRLRKESVARARFDMTLAAGEVEKLEAIRAKYPPHLPGYREAHNAVVAARGRMRSARPYADRVLEDLQAMAEARCRAPQRVHQTGVHAADRVHHWSMD